LDGSHAFVRRSGSEGIGVLPLDVGKHLQFGRVSCLSADSDCRVDPLLPASRQSLSEVHSGSDIEGSSDIESRSESSNGRGSAVMMQRTPLRTAGSALPDDQTVWTAVSETVSRSGYQASTAFSLLPGDDPARYAFRKSRAQSDTKTSSGTGTQLASHGPLRTG